MAMRRCPRSTRWSTAAAAAAALSKPMHGIRESGSWPQMVTRAARDRASRAHVPSSVIEADQHDAVDAALKQFSHLLDFVFEVVIGYGHEKRVAIERQPALEGGNAGGEDGIVERRDHRADGEGTGWMPVPERRRTARSRDYPPPGSLSDAGQGSQPPECSRRGRQLPSKPQRRGQYPQPSVDRFAACFAVGEACSGCFPSSSVSLMFQIRA